MFTQSSRRRRPFRPSLDGLSSRIVPTVFTPIEIDMGSPPLPDSTADTETLSGDDVPLPGPAEGPVDAPAGDEPPLPA